MKKSLTFTQVLSIGLLLFAILFGAGNVIFPPILGQNAGKNVWIAITGFILGDVVLSLIAIIAVTLRGGNFDKLCSRIHPKFSTFLSIIIYFTIGPLCAIPRTGAVSYQTSTLALMSGKFHNQWLIQLVFTLIFFAITYFVSLNPSKLVNSIGKFITPILLFLLGVVVIKSIISPIGTFSEPIGEYTSSPFFKGFISGYLTLDVLGALIISVIVINSIKQFGITDPKSIVKNTIISGLIAALGLILVYFSLGYVGASSISLGKIDDGAKLLSIIMNHLFGKSGTLLLGLVITFACLTTSIGMTSSFADYFSKLLNRFSYKKIVGMVCLFSFAISNLGLNTILKLTEPILTLIYPVVIVLIFTSFFDKFIKSKTSIYIGGMIGAFIVSLIQISESLGFLVEPLLQMIHKIPFYNLGIGWLIPSLIGCSIGYMLPYKN